jgi:hypothetical protein
LLSGIPVSTYGIDNIIGHVNNGTPLRSQKINWGYKVNKRFSEFAGLSKVLSTVIPGPRI